MTENAKKVSFVCLANYCRSPVAKILFKNKFSSYIDTDSAGIRPMISAGMDPRSANYLKENKISYELHNPKKVDKHFFNSSDIVFAMDTNVLMQLNLSFKNQRNKIKLFSFQHSNVFIPDPYKFSDQKYKNVMNDISFIIDNLDLEKLFG